MDGNVAGGVALPVECDAKVVANHPHEVDLGFGGKKTLKFCFDLVGRGVVDEVVDKVGKVEGWVPWDDFTGEDTG